MRVKLWGVRGSLPTPLSPAQLRERLEWVVTEFDRRKTSGQALKPADFIASLPAHVSGGYGGNTACAEVTHAKSRLLIDGGSGLRAFSEHILASSPKTEEFHIYFTHFHWDHVIGLPFFAPVYMKNKTVHCYAVHDQLEEYLRTIFRKPNFPVPYEVISKQIKIHKLEPRQPAKVGGFTLTPYQLDHPDPCWGARIEAGGKSLAWAVDTECSRITHEELGEDTKLYNGADLMVFDAQYSFDEALEKINWGHASGPIGIDLAMREGVKRVLFIHHDPAASDDTIRAAEEQTRVYYDEILRARKQAGLKTAELDWHFAHEGETIQL